MDTHTHNTRLSRRTMLAGGLSAPVTAIPSLQAFAALSDPTLAIHSPDSCADTELFHRIAVAEQARKQQARLRRLHARLQAVRAAREVRDDLMAPPFREDHSASWHRFRDAFEAYATAVRAAVSLPARTAAGVHAKLRLGAIAARRGPARVYMFEDREWLDAVLTDLQSLADHVSRS